MADLEGAQQVHARAKILSTMLKYVYRIPALDPGGKARAHLILLRIYPVADLEGAQQVHARAKILSTMFYVFLPA